MSTYDGLRFVYLMAQRGLVPGLGVGFADYPIAPGLLSPWDFPLEDEVTAPRQPAPAPPKICGKMPDCGPPFFAQWPTAGVTPLGPVEAVWSSIEAYSDACELDIEAVAPCVLIKRPPPVMLRAPPRAFPTLPGFPDEIVRIPEWKDRTWILGTSGALLTLRHGTRTVEGDASCVLQTAEWDYTPPVGAPFRVPSALHRSFDMGVLSRPGSSRGCFPGAGAPCAWLVFWWEYFTGLIRNDFGCP